MLEYESVEFIDDADREYGSAKTPSKKYPYYKVWNANPQNPGAERTPGIVMSVKDGDSWTNEIVPRLRAVILYTSFGRSWQVDNGKTVKCQSHDGKQPALAHLKNAPCGKLTSEDVATVLLGWKNADKAKVDAQVAELTEDGKLSFCGISIKGKPGEIIPLCPMARANKAEDIKVRCKPYIFMHCYDLDRQREFKMTLTGQSTYNNDRFISPFHTFMASLAKRGQDGKPIKSFNVEVELSTSPNGAMFYLNLKELSFLSPDIRTEMKNRAVAAYEEYQKNAHRLSKEEYEKNKSSQTQPQAQATSVQQASPEPVQPARPAPPPPISFEDDDIPF